MSSTSVTVLTRGIPGHPVYILLCGHNGACYLVEKRQGGGGGRKVLYEECSRRTKIQLLITGHILVSSF